MVPVASCDVSCKVIQRACIRGVQRSVKIGSVPSLQGRAAGQSCNAV